MRRAQPSFYIYNEFVKIKLSMDKVKVTDFLSRYTLQN